MSLNDRIQKGLDFNDDTYYVMTHVYTSLVVQVHSVVVTQKNFQYLRVWRARSFGPAKFTQENEDQTYRVTQEIFKSYIVPPNPRIGKAIEYFGKEYLLEIAVYDNHQEVLKTVNSGDFLLLHNVHIGSKNNMNTLSIHGGGVASYNREIAPIPANFVDPKFRLFQKRCERMLEQVTDYENFEEFVVHEEVEAVLPDIESEMEQMEQENFESELSEVEHEKVETVTLSEFDKEGDNMFSEPYKNIIIGEVIAVNCFTESFECVYHFLTHVHPEYIRGLDLTADRIVFCSSTTAEILPEMMGVDSKIIPEGTIFPMQLNHPYTFDGFQATMIDSNHCPGSVMILFEGELIREQAGGPVLCTGDFRADKTFLSELKCGPCRFLTELKLARIYIGNTYFSLDQSLLHLNDARDLLVKIIESNPDKNIIIPLHRLGRELLIESTIQTLNEPIFMYKEKLEVAKILKMHEKNSATNNKTRKIEIVEKEKWDYSVPENSMIVNISMNDCPVESYSKFDEKKKVINIRYSDHSSKYEILRFLNNLNFDSIYPSSKKFSKNEMRIMLEAGKQYQKEHLDRQLNIHQYVTSNFQELSKAPEVFNTNIGMNQVSTSATPDSLADTCDTGFWDGTESVQTVPDVDTLPVSEKFCPENTISNYTIDDEPTRKHGKFQNLLGKIMNI